MIRRDKPAPANSVGRIAIAVLAVASAAPISVAQAQTNPSAATVRISVFSLFHPRELVLRPAQGSHLTVELGGRTQAFSSGDPPIVLRATAGAVEASGASGALIGKAVYESPRLQGSILRAHAVDSRFWLDVPGKLRRVFSGTLEVRAHGQVLEAIVTMPLETAVASVVAAESPPGAGIEALKAQAVAARSFLVARQAAHAGFDFCDTTHCQFLRSPPPQDSPAAQATRTTQGLVLTWHDEATAQDRPLAAMYARSCGGRTRTLREIGLPASGYPYYAVHCTYCTHHPEIWQRETRSEPRTEQDRLAFNRLHGWGAIPSLAQPANQAGSILGKGNGHGLGLCQLGAADMARHGATFAAILAHYYPNTTIQTNTATEAVESRSHR